MRTARPVIVVSTGRSGSTMLSNMVRKHPELLSLSEFFILLGDRAFPEGPVTGARFWEILSRPYPQLHLLQRSGLTFAELLYQPVPGGRFTAEAGIPPLLVVALPHLADDPEGMFDEIGAWASTRGRSRTSTGGCSTGWFSGWAGESGSSGRARRCPWRTCWRSSSPRPASSTCIETDASAPCR